tara:strand:+ start:81 stop:503 length:423 start_codon:yes stop_codon:yes gene_type:complete
MSKISIALNSIGITVSFTCFIHCVFVILLFLGLMTSDWIFFFYTQNGPNISFEFFSDDFNHLILILSSLFLATLSQIKIMRDIKNQSFRGIQVMMQKQLIFAGSLLVASLFLESIFSEILVICGALIILSMHAKKLLRSY